RLFFGEMVEVRPHSATYTPRILKLTLSRWLHREFFKCLKVYEQMVRFDAPHAMAFSDRGDLLDGLQPPYAQL
ncbi:MAG: hypothetical protein OEU26_18270, partial [Candidatus Tectomicrobia bacterium]|nr:hypothetical protein [Candidatus Tectomicrobia bacterium]